MSATTYGPDKQSKPEYIKRVVADHIKPWLMELVRLYSADVVGDQSADQDILLSDLEELVEKSLAETQAEIIAEIRKQLKQHAKQIIE